MGQLYPLPYGAMSPAWLPTYEATVLQVVGYAEIWSPLDPNGLIPQTLLLGGILYVSGSVTIDRNNIIRRTATNITLLLDGAGLLLPIAGTTDGYYSPEGNELRLYKGCVEPGTGTPAVAASVSWAAAESFPFVVTPGFNDGFEFVTGGPTEIFTVAGGSYADWAALVAAFNAATGSVSGEPFSTYCLVTYDGTNVIVTEQVAGSFANGYYLTNGAGGRIFLEYMEAPDPSTLAGGSDAIAPTPTTEYAQLGVFLIEEVDVKDDGGGVTMVGTMNDRGEWISRRKFALPYTTNGISVVGDIINNILFYGAGISYASALTETGSAWSLGSSPCPYVPPVATYNIGDDPWQAACDMAAAAGLQLYFDYQGDLVLEYIPDPNSISPCVAYLEGTSTAPVTLARAVSNKAVPNVICVMSQGSSVTAPVQVWWWDSNPSSPTYYAAAPGGGWLPTNPQYTLPIRDVAATYPELIQQFDSTLIGPTFQADQAQAVAIAIGLTAIGSLESATFTIRDQPAHDVDDVITFQRVIAGRPDDTDYIVDQVQVDLTPTTAEQLTTRLIYAT